MGKYGVIIIDPPWFYNNRNTGGERKKPPKFGGGCRKHYPVIPDHVMMPALAIIARELAAENCAIFMWVVRPKIGFCTDCMEEMAERIVTMPVCWRKLTKDGKKEKYGPGGYTASNPEDILLGINGKMPVKKKMLPSFINAPRREHSRKPDEQYALIEAQYPDAKKIEVFARAQRPGWDVYGNQVKGSIKLPGLENFLNQCQYVDEKGKTKWISKQKLKNLLEGPLQTMRLPYYQKTKRYLEPVSIFPMLSTKSLRMKSG